MAKKFPILPSHPERVCWGCDKYCPADSMMCGNGSVRTQHPCELFGPDWNEWGLEAEEQAEARAAAGEAPAEAPGEAPGEAPAGAPADGPAAPPPRADRTA